MFDKDSFKQSLTVSDIHAILNHYGADYHEGRQGEVVSATICHNKSGGSHKLYYYPESHSFHCYTGCGSFDIYEMIMRVNQARNIEMNFTEAIKEIALILGMNINFKERRKGVIRPKKTIKDWEWMNRVTKKPTIVPELKVIDKSVLNTFDKIYPSAWYEEGISLDSMEKYGIRFYGEAFQTIIPHHDADGNLIGIRSRNWDKESMVKAKYIPTYVNGIGYNHPLGYALYGLHQNKETIQRKKKAMIVEGEKSCLFADTMYGADNFVVAMCGSNLSKYQADLLINLGVEQVIIAIDKDYLLPDTVEYERYMEKVKKIGKLFNHYVSTFHLTDTRGLLDYKESPLDLPKDKLEDMMENDKYRLTIKELEKVD